MVEQNETPFEEVVVPAETDNDPVFHVPTVEEQQTPDVPPQNPNHPEEHYEAGYTNN